MSTMSQRSHFTDSEAWRVVGRLEGGETQAEVAQAIGVSQSVISRISGTVFWRLEVQAEDQDKIAYFHLDGPGSRNNPAFVHESVRFGGGGMLVYGGISIDRRTDLYIIRDGPLTARRYRPHRANLVEDFLFEEGIVRMEWTACSPDMTLWNDVFGTL
ncbi:transposable element Tcb2 transposase [Trichonephila clavipes]|nr:transposable element Tcb2 transposase [Trichonephila clavipes]